MKQKMNKIFYYGVAHPWLCDSLGHMNTRHYVAMFDDAAQHFLRSLGWKCDASHGWADVKSEISYMAEILAGELTHIECALIKTGTKTIRFEQTMYVENRKCAVNIATCVLMDLNTRKAVALPSEITK